MRDVYIGPLSKESFRVHAVRALLDWCEDEGYTPYVAVSVDDSCVVPREYVNSDNTIVLCVSTLATRDFELDKDGMRFKTRFGEAVCAIDIPLCRIAAVFPKENTDLVSYFPDTTAPEPKKTKPENDIPVFTKL